ncbi:MAG: aminoglycoside 6-adenylyltransferase, partial [Treponema sp.]|nr:aminoglycoside 6-adenylyltransferase [Treponema sp.]
MRSEQEMMDLILSFAGKDERIRVVTMEGSRLNKNAPRDQFQDYDISYIVTDLGSF